MTVVWMAEMLVASMVALKGSMEMQKVDTMVVSMVVQKDA